MPVQEHLAPEEIERLIVPEQGSLVSKVVTRAAGNIAADVEFRTRRPNTGEIRLLCGEPRLSAMGRLTAALEGVVRDITDRKLTHDALVSSKAFYR